MRLFVGWFWFISFSFVFPTSHAWNVDNFNALICENCASTTRLKTQSLNYKYMHAYTHAYIQIHTNMHMCIHIYTHIHMLQAHTCICTYMHTCAHTFVCSGIGVAAGGTRECTIQNHWLISNESKIFRPASGYLYKETQKRVDTVKTILIFLNLYISFIRTNFPSMNKEQFIFKLLSLEPVEWQLCFWFVNIMLAKLKMSS